MSIQDKDDHYTKSAGQTRAEAKEFCRKLLKENTNYNTEVLEMIEINTHFSDVKDLLDLD